jgi:hypothetical protein
MKMLPLYADDHFTFHFADDRLIPRFHLEGMAPGRWIEVFRLDSLTGARGERLATAAVGDAGWVELTEPLIVRAGDTFVAVPSSAPG